MDLKRVLDKILRVDSAIDRIIDWMFVLFAFGFGGWIVWSVLGGAEVGLVVRIGGALIGALVSAVVMWVVWFFARALF